MPSGPGEDGTLPDDDMIDNDPDVSWSDITGLPDWLQTLSAIGTGGAAVLVTFVDDPVGFITEIVLVQFVGWVLSMWEVFMSILLAVIEEFAASLWHSTVAPLQEGLTIFWTDIVSSLEVLRLTTESSLAELGLGAPFVALGGFVAVLLVVTIIVSIIWALLETYLPTEAIERELRRFLEIAFIPFRMLQSFFDGAAAAVRERIGEGDHND